MGQNCQQKFGKIDAFQEKQLGIQKSVAFRAERCQLSNDIHEFWILRAELEKIDFYLVSIHVRKE